MTAIVKEKIKNAILKNSVWGAVNEIETIVDDAFSEAVKNGCTMGDILSAFDLEIVPKRSDV